MYRLLLLLQLCSCVPCDVCQDVFQERSNFARLFVLDIRPSSQRKGRLNSKNVLLSLGYATVTMSNCCGQMRPEFLDKILNDWLGVIGRKEHKCRRLKWKIY